MLKRGKAATQLETGIKNALNDKTCVRSLAPMVTKTIDHKDIKVREGKTKGTQNAIFTVPKLDGAFAV